MKKETTIITLATMTEAQKAMLNEEQLTLLNSMTGSVSDKIVSSTIKSMLKEAEKAKKLEAAALEKENKKAARAIENEKKHAEKYLSFHTSNVDLGIENERNDLKGMVVVKSSEYGTEVVIPSGHDANAVVVVRQLQKETSYRTLLTNLGLTELRDSLAHEVLDEKVDYEVVFDTKQKRSARTANLVHNNKVLVSGWIVEAIRFKKIADIVEFLQKQVNSKGESRYNTLDLDILSKAEEAGDKTSARLAKKYGDYFTMKGLK